MTRDQGYTSRLAGLQRAAWKRWLGVQLPYRWNLRRLRPGFTLDVGCGLGRNLGHLGGNGVGIDHNPHSVEACRQAGYLAFLPDDFRASPYCSKGVFDSLLVSHVAEHMPRSAFAELLREYVPLLGASGQIIVITPQEAGFRSDPTHVEFVDPVRIRQALGEVGFEPIKQYSFPFPRAAGRFFRYNEFVSVGRRRDEDPDPLRA
jgi:SAM-dependent methyltransferase